MPSQTHDQDRAGGDRRLPPPPRIVPPALARYLSAATLHIPLALLGFALIPFWGDCGFGADVESLLFLSASRPAAGVVTRFEPTGARVSAGSLSPTPHYAVPDVPSVPVYAVHFSYAAAGGARRTGVCFADGTPGRPGVPFAEATAPVADFTSAGADPPLTAGAAVPVEVAGRGNVARIRGARTNLYGMHALIVLVFPGFALFVLIQARRYLRRALRLLAEGREDTAGGRLCDPADAARSVPLARFPLNRVTVSGGELQPPPGSALKFWGAPLLALGCNAWYIWANSAAIFYPIKALLAHGR